MLKEQNVVNIQQWKRSFMSKDREPVTELDCYQLDHGV
jgi:hypothetical protein